MNAKSKADFINSVAAGSTIPCPQCGMVNESDSKFCVSCGTKLSPPQKPQVHEPAFEQVKEEDPYKSAFGQVKEEETYQSAFEQVKEEDQYKPAFGQVKEEKPYKPAFEQAKEKESYAPSSEEVKEREMFAQVSQYVERSNALAEGLPEWTIEPPQVMVRRRS